MINTFTRYRQQYRRERESEREKKMLSINRHKIMKKKNNKRAICSFEYEYKIEKDFSLVLLFFRLLTCF
jgi:hypothetical protein